ncbi:hypothetical protein EJ110_NYTH23065 [Nymphaea thermarum]|nr:hypothetical protein EJ110_NYTH23065 [Nymphaea thermarum]
MLRVLVSAAKPIAVRLVVAGWSNQRDAQRGETKGISGKAAGVAGVEETDLFQFQDSHSNDVKNYSDTLLGCCSLIVCEAIPTNSMRKFFISGDEAPVPLLYCSRMASQISKKRRIITDGVFYAEMKEPEKPSWSRAMAASVIEGQTVAGSADSFQNGDEHSALPFYVQVDPNELSTVKEPGQLDEKVEAFLKMFEEYLSNFGRFSFFLGGTSVAQACMEANTGNTTASSRFSSLRKKTHEVVHAEITHHEGSLRVTLQVEGQGLTLSWFLMQRPVCQDWSSQKFSSGKHSEFRQDHQPFGSICGRLDRVSNHVSVCASCKVAAHMDYYHILKNQFAPWYFELREDFCRQYRGPAHKNIQDRPDTECSLCGRLGGAFRKTTDAQWVHVTCAEWLLESTYAQKEPAGWREDDHEQDASQGEGPNKNPQSVPIYCNGCISERNTWEEQMQKAQEHGKLVFLSNLDPSYNSAEVEDYGLDEECYALGTPSPKFYPIVDHRQAVAMRPCQNVAIPPSAYLPAYEI